MRFFVFVAAALAVVAPVFARVSNPSPNFGAVYARTDDYRRIARNDISTVLQLLRRVDEVSGGLGGLVNYGDMTGGPTMARRSRGVRRKPHGRSKGKGDVHAGGSGQHDRGRRWVSRDGRGKVWGSRHLGRSLKPKKSVKLNDNPTIHHIPAITPEDSTSAASQNPTDAHQTSASDTSVHTVTYPPTAQMSTSAAQSDTDGSTTSGESSCMKSCLSCLAATFCGPETERNNFGLGSR